MKRFLFYFSGLIVFLCLTFIVVLSVLPSQIAGRLSNLLGVGVSIEKIFLSPKSVSFTKTRIDNILDSVLPTAFSAETISFEAPLTNYLGQEIVIEEIDLDTVYLGLEFASPRDLTSNWTSLMAPLSSDESSEPSSKTRVLIKTLVISRIRVDVVYKNQGKKVIALAPIDRIVLTNISSEAGLPMKQIMNSVLGQMLKSVFIEENLKDAVKKLLQDPTNAVENLLSPLKGFIGK